MNKIFKSLLVVATMSTAAFAQVNEQEEQQHTCGTMHAWQELCNQYPGLEQSMTKFEEDSKLFEARLSGFPKDGNKVIIPVVVHVIHKGGSENISKQQIQEQINILNDDFKGLNSDTTNIPLPFRAILGKMNIEFRLATKDPMGNCTDGIVRVFSSKTDNANNANGVKSVSYWNSYNYFNVWIVNTIGLSIQGAGTVLGYAQFPSGPNFVQLASTDGVVVIHNYFGSTGTANGRKGRTLTHEAGHWFGLRHIWGDADCGDDGIDDTPVAKNPNFGICTNNFPYNVGACVPASVNPLGEMYMNYMDYSDDACMAMFSKGQVARMRSVVEDDTLLTFNTEGELISVSVTPAFRRYLSNEANLLATGTNDGAPQNPCAPIADFNRNLKMVCTNVNVQFQDVSYNGNIQSRNWTFQGGTPATATSASVNVKYESAGAYPASLDVTNPTGSSSVTRTDVVYVTDPAAASTGNFSESFATEEDYNKWLVFNDDNSLFNKWKWVNFGRTDGGSVRMENFGNIVGEIDEFITPAYNLSSFQGVNNLNMQFWLAGAERGGIPVDRLVISSSTNCGQTWSIRRTIQGYALVTAGLRSSFYSAWNPGDFQPFIVNAGPVAGNTNVRFRFQFTRGAVASNNIYIDDIDFGASIGIDDVANQIGLNLFPNPSNDQTQLNFVLDKKSTVSIDLIDVLGRNVLNVYAGVLQPGEHNPTINLSSLSNGVYTVRMLVDGKLASKRLIKQ